MQSKESEANMDAGMQEVHDFLKKVGTYYIASEDGDQPRVRPFGTINEFEGKLYFQTGLSKKCAKQFLENPKIEICAHMGAEWVRIAGEAVLDERIEAQQDLLDNYPSLADRYKAGDGNNCVFYLQNAVATFSSFTTEDREVKF